MAARNARNDLCGIRGVQRLHTVCRRLVKILSPYRDHIRKIAIDPLSIRFFHPFAPAVEPASDVQHQRLRMFFEHAIRPVVEHAGPHRHVVGEPLGLRLAADRKAFRLPDPLGIRIAYNDALFADKRFAVQRDEKRSVHFVHTYPFIAQTGRPDRQARAVIAGATGRPGLRSTITFS